MNDIEEDPELRANINLYKDDDVINELEKQLAAMTIDETKKSPIGEALEKGSATVQGKDRKIIKASRLTNQAIGRALKKTSLT